MRVQRSGPSSRAIERGVDEVQLARAIVRYLRDLSVLQVAPDEPELIDASDEERAELAAEAKQIDRSRVTQMFDRMLRCCDELGKTLQPRLVLDCALIDVATIEPLVPLGDLIDRLGELEVRLAEGVRPASSGGGGGGGSRAPRRAEAGAGPAPRATPRCPGRPAPCRRLHPSRLPRRLRLCRARVRLEPCPVRASAPMSMQPSVRCPRRRRRCLGQWPPEGAMSTIPAEALERLGTGHR